MKGSVELAMADLVDFRAVHADHIEEGLAIDVEAGACAAALRRLHRAIGILRLLAKRSGRGQRGSLFRQHRGLQIRLAAHDRGQGSGEVPAGVAVIRQAESHQQSAQVGVSQTQRAIIVGVARDRFGRIAGVVDQDIHRGDHDGDGMAISGHIKGAGRIDEFEQVEAGQVAGRIVQEHVLGARIRGIDAAGVLGGVPLVDRGVVLHPRIAAFPGGFGDLVHQLAGF